MKCGKITYDRYCNIIIQDEFDNEFVSVYILQLNRPDGKISQSFIKETSEEKVEFDIKEDGFYTLVTIKVPINPQSIYYYKDGKFYKNVVEEVDLQELIDVNPEYSGLDIQYDYFMHTCGLRNCYINICQEIFDQRAPSNCDNTKIDSNLIYKRDLLWSALNVIKYMVDMDQYEEAERLLLRVSGCNGLCKQTNTKVNCGCGK